MKLIMTFVFGGFLLTGAGPLRGAEASGEGEGVRKAHAQADDGDAVRVTRVYSLRNAEAGAVAQTVQRLNIARCIIMADSRAKSVIVSAPEAVQSEVQGVIKRLDEPERSGGGPGIQRVFVRADQAIIEGQGHPGYRLILGVGETTNRWDYTFTNETRFTASLDPMGGRSDPIGRRGFSWVVSDGAGNVLFATATPRFGAEEFKEGRMAFREGTLAPEPDGSVVVAWFKLGTGGLVPITVRLESPGLSLEERLHRRMVRERQGQGKQ